MMCNLGEITNNYAVTVGQSNRSEYKLCGAELPVKVTKQGCQPRADIATMQSHCLDVTAEVSCAKRKKSLYSVSKKINTITDCFYIHSVKRYAWLTKGY